MTVENVQDTGGGMNGADTGAVVMANDDADLEAAFDKVTAALDAGGDAEPAKRGPGGRFAAAADTGAGEAKDEFLEPEGDQQEQPLEGGEGEPEAGADVSTVSESGKALPANWVGKEEVWAKIPDDLKPVIAEHQRELHQRMSQQGRQLAAFQPIAEVIAENKHYFDGTVSKHEPGQAVKFLFEVQRSMDANPVQTLLEIADRYQVRDKLAELFGGVSAGDGAQSGDSGQIKQLQQTISGLQAQLAGLDPENIEGRISTVLDKKASADELGRFAESKPLFSEVAGDMPYFINKAWQKLGANASRTAVLDHAYTMAINADPDLRAKAAAHRNSAAANAGKPAAAVAAKAVNVRSTSSGKTRDLTEDEILSRKFDQVQAQ